MASKLERYVTTIPASDYLQLAVPIGDPHKFSEINFLPIVGWTVITELLPNLPPSVFSQPVGVEPLPPLWAIYDTRSKLFIVSEENTFSGVKELLAWFNRT